MKRSVRGPVSLTRLMLLLAAGALLSLPSFGDTITYKNGKVIKGLIEESDSNADIVIITTAFGRQNIYRERVQKIDRESQAQGYIEIGDDLRVAKKLDEAIRMYQQALTAEPNNALAQKMIDQAQADMTQEQSMDRQKAIKQIDTLTSQSVSLIGSDKFPEAESLLKQAGELVPTDSQRTAIRKTIGKLYLAWANEREDKLDKIGMEDKLNLALAADPDNEEVVEKMLKLWENDPAKRENSVNIYETILERHPNDDQLRKKLGDLYYTMNRPEDAVHHYLILYKQNDSYKGTDMEQRLFSALDRLHKQYARMKDYDKAIKYYQILSAINPETDPSVVIYYNYLKMAQTVKPNNPQGLLQLAQYAQEHGMQTQAMENYRKLLGNESTRDAARTAIDSYAVEALNHAQEAFKKGDYVLARALADQVRQDYPDSAKIQDQLTDLIGQTSVLIARKEREKVDQSKQLVDDGNTYYEQATYYFNSLYSTERRSLSNLGSARSNAVRYYQLAMNAYSEALRINPSLASSPNSIINVRLSECRDRVKRLTTLIPVGDSMKFPTK